LKAIKRRYAATTRALDQKARMQRGTDATTVKAQRAAAAERDDVVKAQRAEIRSLAAESYQWQQSQVQSRIEAAGARVLEKYTTANLVYVEIPGTMLDAVAAYPEVAAVFESRRKQIDSSFTAMVMGAP